MVSTRFCCVVTLTMVAVFTLCKTANGTTKISGAEESQKYGPDSPSITDPLDARQRWPARSLKSAASPGVLNWSSFRVGKLLSQKNVPNSTPIDHVAELFQSFKVKSVKPVGFFASEQFIMWEGKVWGTYKHNAEQLILETLLRQFHDDVNGGVDAILANGIERINTAETAKRFENLLLGKMAKGIKKGETDSKRDFVRYAHYRGDQRDDVVKRMQKMMNNQEAGSEWFSTLETELFLNAKTYSEKLDAFFSIIGKGASIEVAFQRLSVGKKIENDAFLLNLLARKASDINPKENLAKHMVERLQKMDWTDDNIRSSLETLDEMAIPSSLRTTLVMPMWDALKQPRVVKRTISQQNAPMET